MEDVLNVLGEQPLLLVVSVFLLGGAIFFLLRNLLRLLVVVALGMSALAGLYYLAEAEEPEMVEHLRKDAGEKFREGVKQVRKASQRMGEDLGSEMKEAAHSQLKSLQGQ